MSRATVPNHKVPNTPSISVYLINLNIYNHSNGQDEADQHDWMNITVQSIQYLITQTTKGIYSYEDFKTVDLQHEHGRNIMNTLYTRSHQ